MNTVWIYVDMNRQVGDTLRFLSTKIWPKSGLRKTTLKVSRLSMK